MQAVLELENKNYLATESSDRDSIIRDLMYRMIVKAEEFTNFFSLIPTSEYYIYIQYTNENFVFCELHKKS